MVGDKEEQVSTTRCRFNQMGEPNLQPGISAVIRLHRESNPWQSGLSAYRVRIDGKKVGEIGRGETFDFGVWPGTHQVKVTEYVASIFTSRTRVVSLGVGQIAARSTIENGWLHRHRRHTNGRLPALLSSGR